MNEDRRKELATFWGTASLIVTLCYVGLGIPMQLWDIFVGARIPSLFMMVFACMTFLSWTIWASLKREKAPLIANAVGFATSLMVVGLTIWVTTVGPIESGKPATTSDSENTSIESFSRPPAAIIDKTASFPKSSRFDTGVNHE